MHERQRPTTQHHDVVSKHAGMPGFVVYESNDT